MTAFIVKNSAILKNPYDRLDRMGRGLCINMYGTATCLSGLKVTMQAVQFE
jgi:hypothetical protein